MAVNLNASSKDAIEAQRKIELYRSSFVARSRGFELPKIDYLGNLSKNLDEKNIADFFISIPIKNQENIIARVLETLIDSVDFKISIGLLFDNCNDRSLDICKDYFEKNFESYPNLEAVHFITSENELFESTAENLLFLLCHQKFFVSLQADTYFLDKNFFKKSALAFSLIPNLFAVSGRGLVLLSRLHRIRAILNKIFNFHNFVFQFLPDFKHVKKLGLYLPNLGYFGDLSRPPKSYMRYSNRQLNSIYLGQAIIRGPIVWLSKVFQELNCFDDIGFSLGRDDCDISLRGALRGYSVGYIPCTAYSIYEEGTTRKSRKSQDQIALDARINLSKQFPGELNKYQQNKIELNKLAKNIQCKKIHLGDLKENSITLSDRS
jgi:GT2 family glycosyltransferase